MGLHKQHQRRKSKQTWWPNLGLSQSKCSLIPRRPLEAKAPHGEFVRIGLLFLWPYYTIPTIGIDAAALEEHVLHRGGGIWTNIFHYPPFSAIKIHLLPPRPAPKYQQRLLELLLNELPPFLQQLSQDCKGLYAARLEQRILSGGSKVAEFPPLGIKDSSLANSSDA